MVLEGAEVSRHHAEVLRIGAQWVIHDLHSRNGVYVDGVRVESSILRKGHVLRLGEWLGVVHAFEFAAEGEPAPFRQLAPGFLGGAHLQHAVVDAERVAHTRVPIVIQGETGVGKSQLARAIHYWSGQHGRLIVLNCATTGDLSASGLLGDVHAPADTLLLEEVGDMPLAAQARLLSALQEGADVRVLVTTQVPLEMAVRQGRVRADLSARLSGLTIVLPTLRERREDIPALFAHLLQQHWHGSLPAVEPRLVEFLCRRDWSSNVRELEQLANYLADAHARETCLGIEHLPKSVRMAAHPDVSVAEPGALEEPAIRETVAQQELEKREQRAKEFKALTEALRACDGNVSRTANILGISRQRIYRMMHAASSNELTAHGLPANPSTAGAKS